MIFGKIGKVGKILKKKAIPARFGEYMLTITIKKRFKGEKYADVPQMRVWVTC